jgi:hypothetical protein
MTMPKYRAYFREMVEQNQALFADFKIIHDEYEKDQVSHQVVFNKQGEVVVELIRDWERRLCGGMEKGNNAKYSANLSEKFWNEVRAFFPMIDYVGVKFS